jgi:PAS domain S-box-containing protein
MMQLPDNENEQLKILYKYQILDTEAEAILDDLAELAADFCKTPVALISLVDSETEWFAAKVGVNITEVPRNLSFGSYTLLQEEIFIINDISQDQRFTDHPLLKSDPCFLFYAGVPLINGYGFKLGCLSVMDIQPRSLSAKEQKALKILAQKITYHLDINLQKQAFELQANTKLLQSIFQNIPLMIALSDVNGKVQWVNHNLEKTLGWTLAEFQTQNVFAELYPDPEYRQSVMDFMESAQPIWHDFKCQQKDGSVLDTTWTNVRLADGQTLGIGQDITARNQTEKAFQMQAEREKLMRTVSQRIRQSLNLQDILNATVKEVKELLQVDRVIVYQFASDMGGKIVAESVSPGWKVALGTDIQDSCFQSAGGLEYHQGCKKAISNIYTVGLTDCHLQLLEEFQVKAKLIVPILIEKTGESPISSCLWGLLIAHQCSSPRAWEDNQLDLLEQITVQIAIAIQQSSIFEQAQVEISQRQTAEIQLRSALAEKEVLLKEVHHRVKNNLQIVSSLLQLQAQTLKEPEIIRAIRESQNRIQCISLIHKNLYTSPNIGQLDIAEYINNLAAGLLISYQILPGQIDLQTKINSVKLNIDEAIACGLVINELISNSIKHAFSDQQKGEIIISLHNVNNNIKLTVQDNGIGLPDGIDWRNTNSLGLSLVYDLVTEQLEGNITVERNQGTLFHIQFPQLTLHNSIANGAN